MTKKFTSGDKTKSDRVLPKDTFMTKDFDKWNKLKKAIEEREPPDFRTGDIWWCSIGANLGYEEDGKNQQFERPVLVVRKFNKQLFWGVPLTSKVREGQYYYTVELFGEKRTLIISQLRILSSRRLLRKMHKISDSRLKEIQKNIDSVLKDTANKTTPLKEESRMPNGSLYHKNSKSTNKSQVKEAK